MAELSGDVRISGIINDEEFSAEGSASGDSSTGEYQVKLDYKNVPTEWHPFMYLDPKVGLLFLKEEHGGKNFHSLLGGTYRSSGSIDIGRGNILRNNADIRLTGEGKFVAAYVMTGAAHTGELTGIDYFEETMLPWGPGRIAAMSLARWKTADGRSIDGLFSTTYHSEPKFTLRGPQVRRIEVNPRLKGNSFSCVYKGFVRGLPRAVVQESGPYIGNLIA